MLDVSAELLVTSRRQKLSQQPHGLRIPQPGKGHFHKTSYYVDEGCAFRRRSPAGLCVNQSFSSTLKHFLSLSLSHS